MDGWMDGWMDGFIKKTASVCLFNNMKTLLQTTASFTVMSITISLTTNGP